MLLAQGEARLKDRQGYEFNVVADYIWYMPTTDVATNPPGKTDIVMKVANAPGGVFVNRTVGGREMPPTELPNLELVAIYDSASPACKMTEGPSSLAGAIAPRYNDKACAVGLAEFMGTPRAGGVFDVSAVANRQEYTFTPGDFGFSAAGADGSVRWAAQDEATAEAVVKALSSPLAFGLAGPYEAREGPSCEFTVPETGGSQRVFLLGSQSAAC